LLLRREERESLIPLKDAIFQLRTARELTTTQMAAEIKRPGNARMIQIWEQGRAIPPNHVLTEFGRMAYQLNLHNLVAVFRQAKQHYDKRPDSIIHDVLHLIDERCAELRENQAFFQRDVEERGMSVPDIVARELEWVKSALRNTPIRMHR
jgi:hypothetical protein